MSEILAITHDCKQLLSETCDRIFILSQQFHYYGSPALYLKLACTVRICSHAQFHLRIIIVISTHNFTWNFAVCGMIHFSSSSLKSVSLIKNCATTKLMIVHINPLQAHGPLIIPCMQLHIGISISRFSWFFV